MPITTFFPDPLRNPLQEALLRNREIYSNTVPKRALVDWAGLNCRRDLLNRICSRAIRGCWYARKPISASFPQSNNCSLPSARKLIDRRWIIINQWFSSKMRSGRNRELGENRDHAMITIFLDAKGFIIDSQLDFGVFFCGLSWRWKEFEVRSLKKSGAVRIVDFSLTRNRTNVLSFCHLMLAAAAVLTSMLGLPHLKIIVIPSIISSSQHRWCCALLLYCVYLRCVKRL